MNYAILFLVALAGIVLGMYLARRQVNTGFIAEQTAKKTGSKQKIFVFMQEQGESTGQ